MKRLMLKGNWRAAAIVRGMLVAATFALALLPLAALLQMPLPSAAQSAVPDSLWAGEGSSIGACADPSSAAALTSCLASPTDVRGIGYEGWTSLIATDGVNVYYASGVAGGLSCPISGLGANCTVIMAGGWGSGNGWVGSLAAADGQIWIGQADGQIFRCPANLPYVAGEQMPSQCEQISAGNGLFVSSLLLANGRLYAGISSDGTKTKNQGYILSCDPYVTNSCTTLDSYGKTMANSLAAGGGYLWAGLDNHIIWRCDLNRKDACATWDTAGYPISSVSYDGQGTLYAAVTTSDNKGVIWSCGTASANRCANLLTGVNGSTVSAGAGSVFLSTVNKGLFFGTSSFNAESPNLKGAALLYIPAEGPTGVGGVSVKVTAGKLSQKVENRCAKAGKTPKALIAIEGPYALSKTMKVGICGLVKGGSETKTFHLLDPGVYTVTATAGKHSGQASFTIEQNTTKPVNVTMARGSKGA